MADTAIEISFNGSLADRHLIDFYDSSRAMLGFQRSLAITVHAVINGEVITQAPSLKGAYLLVQPSEAGSWKSKALVVVGGIVAANQIPQDTPLGHLIFSAYDYVLSQSLGVHADYDRSIGQLVADSQRSGLADSKLNEAKLESVIERCEPAIIDMHRPVVYSRTAESARLVNTSTGYPVGPTLDEETFLYISESIERPKPYRFSGIVSSYNVNTYRGRVFIPELGRTVPFSLTAPNQSIEVSSHMADSLGSSASERNDIYIHFDAIVIESRTKRIKNLIICNIQSL